MKAGGPASLPPMNISDAIAALERSVPDPSVGLPDPVFYYISKTTPLVNVDLLVKDEEGRTLLAWRDDGFAGKGWHLPGGIVRFKETFEARVHAVARTEIGAPVEADLAPLAINQLIHAERAVRGHFISILYRCRITGSLRPGNPGRSGREAGLLQWHDRCPDDLLRFQDFYRKFF